MQLREFYSLLLPASGRYALFQNKNNIFFDTLDDLTAATEARIATQGLYFATASYGDEDRRTQANVRLLKAHRIDIDAGEKKYAKDPDGTYPTQNDAISALMRAIKDGLPRPSVVVSSGEGLHIYWALSCEVEPEDWKPVALLLNTKGKRLGLKIDVVCTADEARVLRPIGSPHPNGKVVQALKTTNALHTNAEFASQLQALFPGDNAFLLAGKPKRVAGPSLNDDILSIKSPPASLARVAEHCAAVAEMRDKLGNVPEPMWRGVMGVGKYCEVDGEALIHEWSAGHPEYNARKTQDKLDRWETPPTSCSHFAGMTSACNGCTYSGKVTTPKQLGYVQVVESTPEPLPTLPAPMATTDAEGDPDAGFGVGMSLPDDDEAPSVTIRGTSLALEATASNPVPDRPDLFDESQAFFYRRNGEHWTLYHRFKITTTDATGQKVASEVIKPVVHKLVWANTSSDVGASEVDGVLVEFGSVARPGSTQQNRFGMSAGIVSEVGTLVKFMIEKGVNIEPTNNDAGKHLRFFILKEIIRKQNDMRFVIKKRFGYHMHEDQFVCCLGPYTVYPDGTIMKTIYSHGLGAVGDALNPSCLPARAKPVWSGDDWVGIESDAAKYAAFIRKHYGYAGYEKYRLTLAITLASPFMPFAAETPFSDAEALPKSGFVVSMYSTTSGVGKTALEDVICAAYGRSSLRMSGKKSLLTDVAKYTTAQNLAIYPMVLDEVTQNEAKEAAEMVDSLANGQGKVRSGQDGAVQNLPKTWSLVTCLSTNIPQRELLAIAQKNSNALQMRILELDFSDLPLSGDKDAFRNDFREIAGKCGAFGLVQARLVTYLGPEKIAALVERNLKRAGELLNVDQTYRYYTRALAVALTNIQIMGKLSPVDAEDVIATFREALASTQGFVAGNTRSPQDTLAQLLSAASPNVAVTQGFTKRTGNSAGGDLLLNQNVRQPIYGREVKEAGTVMLDRVFVNKWCAENQVSVSTLLPQLLALNLVLPERSTGKLARRVRLGTGLPSMMATPSWCYTFNTSSAAPQVVQEDREVAEAEA